VFDYCDGPEVEAEPGTVRWTTRWCAWVASDGVRYGRVDAGGTRTEGGGELCALFDPGAAPTHLSFCFDQDGRLVAAIQHDATTVQVIKYVSGSPTTFEFAGLTPIVFYNGVLLHDTPICDVVCLYLKAAGDTIYARIQRNDFDTEYELNLDLKTTLSRLCKMDAIQALGQWWLALYAIDTKHRPCVYTSEAYPPWPAEIETKDKITLDVEELFYDQMVLFASVQEAGVQSIGAEPISYDDSIMTCWTPDQKGVQSVAPQEIIYTLMIVFLTLPVEKSTQTVTAEAILYAVIVITTSLPAEKSSQTVGIEEIIYA